MEIKKPQFIAGPIVIRKLKDLTDSRFQRNVHSKEGIERLAKIMREDGTTHPIYILKDTNEICFGHGRRDAALLNGWEEYECREVTFRDADHHYRMVQSDNATAAWSELDLSAINLDFANGLVGPFDIDLLGIKDFEVEPADKYLDQKPTMADKFLIPPFSVLNAREGWWQNRKRQWINMGIQSEIGRGGGA